MPVTGYTNPVDGQPLVAASITGNVTDKIIATYGSHEQGILANGALRHTSPQIDDPAQPETTTPGTQGANVNQRLDMHSLTLSAIMGTSGTGFGQKYASLNSLTWPSLNAVNGRITGVTTAVGSSLVARDANGDTQVRNFTTTGSLTVTTQITAGAAGVVITTPTGNLDA